MRTVVNEWEDGHRAGKFTSSNHLLQQINLWRTHHQCTTTELFSVSITLLSMGLYQSSFQTFCNPNLWLKLKIWIKSYRVARYMQQIRVDLLQSAGWWSTASPHIPCSSCKMMYHFIINRLSQLIHKENKHKTPLLQHSKNTMWKPRLRCF